MKKGKSVLFQIMDATAAELAIRPPDKFVLVTLAKHLNPERNGALVWPSQARLCDLTGYGESTVRRSLAALEARGYIKRQKSEARHNVYTVNSDVISAAIDTGQSDRYLADTGQSDRCIPVRATGDTGQSDRLMVNRTTNRNGQNTIVGRSPGRKECSDDHQRRLALLGVVDQVAGELRTNSAERPTEEKPKKRASA